MAAPGSSIPALVILPPNFPSDVNNQAITDPPTASADESPDHASDLSTAQWQDVLSSSSALRAWKGQQIDGKLHIQRAPRAALALKDPKPEFEVYDDSFMETQQSSTSIEHEMILKAFTESGIRAAVSGGANGLTFGLGGGLDRKKEESSKVAATNAHSTVHGFYNFPRVTIYLEPESLQLSEVCKSFFDRFKNEPNKDEVLKRFYARFGGFVATKVTLGGRLCTTQEVKTDDKSEVSEAKKEVLKQLTATLVTPVGGFDNGGKRNRVQVSSEQVTKTDATTRMMIQTQGGNALLAANITDWTASVGSYRYWRVIQQTQTDEILKFLLEVTQETKHHGIVKGLCDHIRKRETGKLGDLSTLGASISGRQEQESREDTYVGSLHLTQPDVVQRVRIIAKPIKHAWEVPQPPPLGSGPVKINNFKEQEFEFGLDQRVSADLKFTMDVPQYRKPGGCSVSATIWLKDNCSFAVEKPAGSVDPMSNEVQSQRCELVFDESYGTSRSPTHDHFNFKLDRSPAIDKALAIGSMLNWPEDMERSR